jgi:glucose-6-phosphate isomerase
VIAVRFDLADLTDRVGQTTRTLSDDEVVRRLWSRDHTVFGPDPAEIADRMGWLDAAEDSLDAWPSLRASAERIAGMADHVVLMGMGGSSLFPEVLAATFGSVGDAPTLHVLDSTHPAAISRLADACAPERTFHIAASKSGSTVETRSQLAFFWERSQDPSRFGVITDPGSALGEDARSAGYAEVWENDPDIGGRFAALSLFGMVPAAVIDADGEAIGTSALDMADALEPLGDEDVDNVGLQLGAAIAEAALAGRDKLTFYIDERIASFGSWVEQLIAESTGKAGKGIVPVVGESPEVASAHPEDRFVVVIGTPPSAEALAAIDAPRVSMPIETETDLGALVLLWEFATAIAGRVLAINPFDQPDVESAKVAARQFLSGEAPQVPVDVSAAELLEGVRPGHHLALTAFVDPGGPEAEEMARIRDRLGRELGAATTLGIGPRFLHSTGQLHKGGPDDIVVVQVFQPPASDLPVPGQSFTFGELFHAQADGDLAALTAAGRRAGRVSLDDLRAR